MPGAKTPSVVAASMRASRRDVHAHLAWQKLNRGRICALNFFHNFELLPQDGVYRIGISLAAGRLHNLAYKPAQSFWLGFDLLDLLRVRGNDLVHDLFNRAGVGDLLQPLLLDDLCQAHAQFRA